MGTTFISCILIINILHVDSYNVHDNYFRKHNLMLDYKLGTANETDIIYKLYTHIDQNQGKYVSKYNISSTEFHRLLPTILIIHGWTTDDTSPWFKPLKDEYFRKGHYNVFYINWSTAGNKTYVESSNNIKAVGEFIADFLIESKIEPKKIHIIGHSLGSQMSGFIGKYMLKKSGDKLGRITALDPAAPLFEYVTPDFRLCDKDAELVDIIHTDIQFSGFAAPLGHVDFYLNNGQYQPGCPSRKIDDNCSHARSTLFFIESVNKKIMAHNAMFVEMERTVIIEELDNDKEVIFGCDVPTTARGVFSLRTNSKKPFLS